MVSYLHHANISLSSWWHIYAFILRERHLHLIVDEKANSGSVRHVSYVFNLLNEQLEVQSCPEHSNMHNI